jgi:hypothetical protein
MFLNNRYEQQRPTSAPTPQGRASRLLVQQKEYADERVKHQRRTTRSDCRHSSPRYFPLWKQVVTLANPLGGPPTSGPNAQSIGLASLCRCLFATCVRCLKTFEGRNVKADIQGPGY